MEIDKDAAYRKMDLAEELAPTPDLKTGAFNCGSCYSGISLHHP